MNRYLRDKHYRRVVFCGNKRYHVISSRRIQFKICKMEKDTFGDMFWVFINDFTAQNRWETSKLVIKNQLKDPFIMKNFQACMRWAKYSRENTAACVDIIEVSCVLSVMEFIFIQTWRLSLLGQPCNIL